MRDVCAQHFISNPVRIGGPGIEVEIDESKFGRRKYNRGRWQEGHWVFGGIERITGSSFLVEVRRAYSTLGTLGYTHYTVNHSVNFAIRGEWSGDDRRMRRESQNSIADMRDRDYISFSGISAIEFWPAWPFTAHASIIS